MGYRLNVMFRWKRPQLRLTSSPRAGCFWCLYPPDFVNPCLTVEAYHGISPVHRITYGHSFLLDDTRPEQLQTGLNTDPWVQRQKAFP